MIISSALVCLSLNIYYEARSEPISGQLAVAMVTYNRANKDVSKICETVAKPKQFSWTNNIASYDGHFLKISKVAYPKDRKAWGKASKVAQSVLSNTSLDITEGSKFYHTKKIDPFWAKKMNVKVALGNHVFY